MIGNIGIILLDGDEVVLRIYGLDQHKQWIIVRDQNYDLTSDIPGEKAASSEIVEIIAGIFFTQHFSDICDWKICARNIADETVHDIAQATGFQIETLTLQKEQNLLCKGILVDME